MTEHDIESVARESIESFNRSDWDWPAAHCGEPFLYEETGTGQRCASVGELVAALQAWKAAIPDGTGEVTRSAVAGDTVVMEVVWRGTQTGPLATAAGDLPPSGRSFEVWATVWARFADGRLVHERHHIDLLSLLAQIGALPAPSPA